jgi:putative exporter of polyketide antibiotics
MPPRTRFLCRLFGLYCILLAAAMLTHRQASISAVTTLVHQPAMLLLLGVIALLGGLAMVLTHNLWSGGGFVVLVTVIGWLILLKALLFLFLPLDSEADLVLNSFRYQQLFPVYMAITLVLGALLSYGGFATHAS